MITLSDIRRARERIAPHIIRTPLVPSPTLSSLCGARVYLKLETMQKAGSFKIRGAMNCILSCTSGIGGKGVIAASAGNHAQGVAVAAKAAGVQATVVMPVWASVSKQAATRSYGARVILSGASLEESIRYARELAGSGMTYIPAFDDPEIIAGQGTIGLEILDDLPETDLIAVPVGGGGLIAGIAVAAKGIRPGVRVLGVQAAACPSAVEAVRAGRPVLVDARPTIADGIRVRQVGDLTFPFIRDLVEEIVAVEEEEIAKAMLLLLERKRVVAEGAGAVTLAALASGRLKVREGSRVVLVVSGGNVDTPLLDRVIHQGLIRNGRILQAEVVLEDAPGALAGLLGVVAGIGGNILQITHLRGGRDLPVQAVRVALDIETRDEEHGRELVKGMEGAGYRVERL
ncbi:MAG TPA: threonine ammonia-lyase [Methanomicrobiales archaeon]|nr:threonine ammonia-lyase [Methanomicrobiales archaeon]